MTKDKLLELEVKLLIARHGRQAVLQTLSAINRVSLNQLEKEISSVGKGSGHRKRRRTKSLDELVEAEHPANNDKKALLLTLMHSYSAREFLPGLKDVRRFLESRGETIHSVRSRVDAMPKVVRALSGLPQDVLRALIEDSDPAKRNDLGILAKEIIGNP